MLSKSTFEELESKAAAILKKNTTGKSTKPSPLLYPHQWNWDSAFIAIGLAHLSEERAQEEILSLVRGQWNNGMIPHIIFNPGYSNYHPGPTFWNTSVCDASPKKISTSGITQPPILADAAYRVFKSSLKKGDGVKFLKSIFPNLKKYYQYFFDHRGAKKEGLAYIIHPWESGLDNSPSWDNILKEIKMKWIPNYERTDTKIISSNQRPSDKEYDKYTYLVELFRKYKYNLNDIYYKSPFIVQSILFNSLLCASLIALEKIANILNEETSEIKQWIISLKNTINRKLWNQNKKMYCDYDLKNRMLICKNTIANYVPIYAGLPSLEIAKMMVITLTSPEQYWPPNGYPLCSVSMEEPEFNCDNYWRGPVWINTNWLIIEGLKKYGYHKEARNLTEKTIEIVLRNGFYEYFDPFTGEGYGTNNFSWTAALIIDLIVGLANSD